MKGTAPLRILGETAYPVTAASARVRLADFQPFLAREGVDLAYRPTLTTDEYRMLSSAAAVPRKAAVLARSAARALRDSRGEELLLIHRLRLLNPVPGIDPPRRLDAYDIDDALFLGSPAEVNRRFQWAKQEARRCIECLRRARLAIVGNGYLAREASRYARRVEVVPSCVDPAAQPLREHADGDIVTIGWIGSHTTSEYLGAVLPVLEAINRERPRARLVVVGGDRRLAADWIEHRDWSLARQAEDLAGFDVGIMPLPDTDWARGKCGYKILQYFSAGVPAVASPIGITGELVGAERGILATSPEQWRGALEALISDPARRREQGARARTFVEAHYSYQRWAPELAKLLRSLAA